MYAALYFDYVSGRGFHFKLWRFFLCYECRVIVAGAALATCINYSVTVMVECSHLSLAVLLTDSDVSKVKPEHWSCTGTFLLNFITNDNVACR